ncbi:MAG: hypothetical protein P4N41_20430 [Negativicutes bacterium]|nr:hypothetical protein [Negativicutes bacterium]
MAEKEDIIGSLIQEMYQTAAELAISADKNTQSRGKKLRKLIESVEAYIKENARIAE